MSMTKYPGLPSEYYSRRKAAYICGLVALFGPISCVFLLIVAGGFAAQSIFNLLQMFVFLSPLLLVVSVAFALAAGSVRRAHERQNP